MQSVPRLYNESCEMYVYDYITKLCRQQAEVIQNHIESIRGLNLVAV
jgi:hypothetical protein